MPRHVNTAEKCAALYTHYYLPRSNNRQQIHGIQTCLNQTATNGSLSEKSCNTSALNQLGAAQTRGHHRWKLGEVIPSQWTRRIGLFWGESWLQKAVKHESGSKGCAQKFMQGAVIIVVGYRFIGRAHRLDGGNVEIPRNLEGARHHQLAIVIRLLHCKGGVG